MTDHEQASAIILQITKELTLAARHAELAARHFSEKRVPEATAHLLAMQGHLLTQDGLYRQIAIRHSEKASIE
jgi:hypothetical protein